MAITKKGLNKILEFQLPDDYYLEMKADLLKRLWKYYKDNYKKTKTKK